MADYALRSICFEIMVSTMPRLKLNKKLRRLRVNRTLLPRRWTIEIAKAATCGVGGAVWLTSWIVRRAFRIEDRPARVHLRGADYGEVWAAGTSVSQQDFHVNGHRIIYLSGYRGLKMVEFGPRQPIGEGLAGRPATPVSPDEKKMEWPCRPSFINLAN